MNIDNNWPEWVELIIVCVLCVVMNSAVVDGKWHFDNLWVSHHQNKKDLMMMRNKKKVAF